MPNWHRCCVFVWPQDIVCLFRMDGGVDHLDLLPQLGFMAAINVLRALQISSIEHS